jgi:uncharacterized protein YjbI with pentapeptide repeats
MEVLTAFVREQAPAKTLPPNKISGERESKKSLQKRKLPSDIQAILTVIGRRTRTFETGAMEYLELSNTNLQGADLAGAQLQGAYLTGAQLQKALLVGAQFQGAFLGGAQLQETFLGGAQLQGADLGMAQLVGAQLQGGDLTEVKNLTQDQINMACTDENTKLPEGLTRPPPCPTNP